MNTKFEFLKVRNLGDVISNSLDFIKGDYKRLGKLILVYILPVLIIISIASAYLQFEILGNMQSIDKKDPLAFFMGKFSGWMFFSYSLTLITHTFLATVVLSYIRFYIKSDDVDFSTESLWGELPKIFGKLLLANFVVLVLVLIGTIFLIIPGIYIGVVFMLIPPIIVFEGLGLGQAISRSFNIVKDNWWKTFGVLVVGVILVSVVVSVLSIPVTVSMVFKTMHSVANKTQPVIMSNGMIIWNSFIGLVHYTLYIIVYVFMAVQYFNLVEQKERPSLQEKINKLV